MPHYVWCPTDAQKVTPEYRLNTIALWIVFGVSIFVLIWYIAASHEARTKVKRSGVAAVRDSQRFQANLLSGMLVSLLVVSILYASFPEPIEATFVVVLALSQASALGWLDFPPGAKFWDVFCTKLPDIFALGLTLWAVRDAMERYFEANGNRNAKYAPMVLRNPWIPFVVCSALNEAVMMVIYLGWLFERKRREEKRIQNTADVNPNFRRYIWTSCAIFGASSVAGAGVGLVFAYWGCSPFSFALWAAPAAVLAGAMYSYFQTFRRLRDFDTAFTP